ncbi:glycoside hydrolase family 97 catalytic domain-containing protein [Galbibacter sp. BG1]|uniref:glycoside hydrolase family 97 protein n=1 Tax=Galbibacter sp. BG1 TaxID=1170699 RepID=UPI0015BFF720|nr:glycoside hydrolase family 97 protein [Galbibacter sp. BG1]QLE01824.1 glycoside hydrolase family 97 catalytic domain-containing protein [Galbibacter sp. BG1]
MKLSVITLLISLNSCKQEQAQEITFSSLNNTIKSKIYTQEGFLFYDLYFESDPVIKNAKLGIVRSDADFSKELSIKYVSKDSSFTQSYKLKTGKQLDVTASGIQKRITVQNESGKTFDVEFQLYDYGYAYRYVFPEQSEQEVSIKKDVSTLKFAAEGKAWLMPQAKPTKWGPAYEQYFEEITNLYEKSPTEEGWCFPALFKLNDTYALVSDAGLDTSYAGLHFKANSREKEYEMVFPNQAEAEGKYDTNPSHTLPWKTSWVTVALSKDLNEIVNSNLVTHVSEENQLQNTSWIAPGRASWSWLADHDSPQDFNKLKEYVDLASEMGWEYSLVDANWNKMKGGDIENLVKYANSKNVGLLLWYNSGGPHNTVGEEPRDKMHLKDIRRATFKKLHDWGIKGVKVDFFQSDKQKILELYPEILKDAADFEILVNFHGASIPRGWARTYPNLVTIESVLGAECYSFKKTYTQRAPVNNTILPFTRNVIGSMDYTPVLFLDNKMPHITSYAHELALSVLFESGIQHFGGSKEGYESIPAYAKDFLRNVPTTWDEVKYLAGTPGKDVILARRKGDCWYFCGINGEDKAKTWTVDTLFIEGEAYFDIISDGKSSRSFNYSPKAKSIEVTVLPYGGFVARCNK